MAGAVYTYTGNADPNRNNTAAIQTSQGKIAIGSSGLFLPSEVEGALGLGLIVKPGPAFSPRSELSALTVAAGTSGSPNGAYLWAATFVTAAGETIAGPTTAFSLTNQQGSISAIPVADPLSGVIARRIYRTVAGGSQLKLVTTINDNVTTVFTDNVADGSLGANIPTSDTSSVVSNQAITPPPGSGSFNFATLTGNPADDIFAISSGTGEKISTGGGGGGGGLSSLTSPDSSVVIGGTLTAPQLGVAQAPLDARYVHQDGTGLPANVVLGTLIPPTPGTPTTATSAPSGSGPFTLAIAMPTAAVGDDAYLWVVGASAPTTPSGWTLEASDTATDAKSHLFKRTLDGTEGASLTVSWSANPSQVVMHMVPVSGQAAGEVYGAFTTHAGAASSVAASVTTPADDSLVLYFQGSADASSETSTPPAGFTELADANAQFGFRQASTGYKTASVSGATTVNATVTESATAALTAVMVAIPSNNFEPLSKAELLATGLSAADLSALVAGPDGKLQPAQQQPSAFGTWQTLGDIGSGGWQTCIECSPHDQNRWLVGGDMLGAGLSTDGGDSWGPTFGFSSWEMTSFTWHPTDGKKVWAGTMSGPYLSTDGGHNFKPMVGGLPTGEFPYPRSVCKILLNPTNPKELWTFNGQQRGFKSSPSGGAINYGQVYHSTDEGVTWATIATVNLNSNITSAAISADGATLLIVSAGNGLYRSTDGGVTWTLQNSGITNTAPVTVQASPITLGTWFAAFALQTGVSNVYTSTDNGATWANAGNLPTSTSDGGWRTIKMAADGLTIWASTASTSMYKSVDAGATWTRFLATKPVTGFSASLGVQFGALGICPTNPNFVIFGTSDEIIRTRDGGLTADSASSRYIPYLNQIRGRGFSGLLGTRVKFHPNVQGTILTTAYDAGAMMLSTDDGLSWTRPTRTWDPFDGGYDVSVGGPTGKVIWVSLGQAGIFNGLGVSTDGGLTFTVVAGSPLPARFGGTRTYNAIRPVSADGLTAIATVGGSIYRTTNGGTTWTLMSGSGHSFQELLVDRTTLGAGATTTVYASGPSGVYISTDGGQTWAGVANSPQNGACIYMKFDPNDHTKLYIAVWQPSSGATANQGLWRLDTGSGTWTRIFNNNCTRDVAVNPFDSNSIVVTTDDNPFHTTSSATGVWWSRDAGATWTQINTGLRMLRIWSIDFDPWHPGRVVAGANGGGFWTTRLVSGLTSGDSRANRLAPEQLGLKGWHEKIPGSSTEMGLSGSVAGPLDANNRLPATQSAAKIVKTTQTVAYTVAVTDLGTIITATSATPVTITIPLTLIAYLAGSTYLPSADDVFFVRQGGAGQVTVAGASGVTVTAYPTGAVKTAGQNATVAVTQTAQDAWLVGGQNST